MPQEHTPTVGRIVHLHRGDQSVRAVIITRVWSPEMINVTEFTPEGLTRPHTSVSHVSAPGFADQQDRWDWPARMES